MCMRPRSRLLWRQSVTREPSSPPTLESLVSTLVFPRRSYPLGWQNNPEIVLLRQLLDGHVPEVNEVPHAG